MNINCTSIKTILLLATVLSSVLSHEYADGKPNCTSTMELNKLYRNLWDPMKYWRCVGINQESVSERCVDGTAFLGSLSRCVPWLEWVWEPTLSNQIYEAITERNILNNNDFL